MFLEYFSGVPLNGKQCLCGHKWHKGGLLGLAPNPYLRANMARSVSVALLLIFITLTLLFLLSSRLGVAHQSVNVRLDRDDLLHIPSCLLVFSIELFFLCCELAAFLLQHIHFRELRPAQQRAHFRLCSPVQFKVGLKHGRGSAISFLVPGQERATRLRASTLGDGYDPEDIKAVIVGERPIPEQPVSVSAAPRRVNLIVDIQERLRSGKGAAYARWAKVYNLKQMAAALQFMQEQNITEYDQLSAKAEDAVSSFHALTEQLRRTEADLSATSELMGAVVRYAKTRPVFDGYKAAKYSRKYLAEHETELADYRATKATMGELLGGEKLPKMAELKEKRRQLAAQKKALYTEYRSAQEEMRQAVAVKANIDHLLGVTDGQRKKKQER